MKVSRRTLLELPVLGVLGLSLCPRSQGQAASSSRSSLPATPANKGVPAPKDTSWPHYAGDLANTRYSPLDQINAGNFKDLEIAWRFKTDSFGPRKEYQFESTPLVVNGVLYTTAGTRRDVVALDAGTGELLWKYGLDEGERALKAPRRLSGRGVEYWTDGREERIFYVTIGYRLVALDAKTGRPVPGFGKDGIVDLKQQDDQDIDPINGDVGLHATPVATRDLVIVGAAHTPGNVPRTHKNVKGYVRAFDARTGRRRWIFHTVPRKGEFGYDTWLNGSAEDIGNTGVWAQISVDEDLGLAYLPVELPTGDENGQYRPGPGLFGETIVAVELQTGQRRWHYQLIHHGLWDRDIPCAPILVDIPVHGRIVKALAQPTKQAFLYVLDRETGKPIWPIVERQVPKGDVPGEWYAATQPFPTKPPAYDLQGITVDNLINFTPELRAKAIALISHYRIGPLFTPPTMSSLEGTWGTLVAPHLTGGTNWPGGSYDPESHFLFVYSKTEPDVAGILPNHQPERSDFEYVRGIAGHTFGRQIRGDSPGAGGGFRPGDLTVDGLPLLKPPYGRLTAIDLTKGEIAWQIAHGETPDEVRNHPALKGLTIPRTGRPGILGPLATKTLLICGEAGTFTTPSGERGAMLRAYDKGTGEEVGAVYMPAPQSGSPMTYLHAGAQHIVVAVSGGDYSGELLAFRLPEPEA